MTATATYTSATKQLAVTGDGLPDPVRAEAGWPGARAQDLPYFTLPLTNYPLP